MGGVIEIGRALRWSIIYEEIGSFSPIGLLDWIQFHLLYASKVGNQE